MNLGKIFHVFFCGITLLDYKKMRPVDEPKICHRFKIKERYIMVNFLITSGGTKIKIDMVRSITNMSRGTFGSKIADFAKQTAAHVSFLCAEESNMPQSKPDEVINYVTFEDYAARLNEQLDLQPDIIILAAAVSDYGVDNYVDGKIRSNDELIIRLKPLPKLISTVRQKCPNAVICGFKLLVNSTDEELESAAIKSFYDNDCDIVVGNDLRDIKNSNHKLMIVERDYSPSANDFVINRYEKYYLAEMVVKTCLRQYKLKHKLLNGVPHG